MLFVDTMCITEQFKIKCRGAAIMKRGQIRKSGRKSAVKTPTHRAAVSMKRGRRSDNYLEAAEKCH